MYTYQFIKYNCGECGKEDIWCIKFGAYHVCATCCDELSSLIKSVTAHHERLLKHKYVKAKTRGKKK